MRTLAARAEYNKGLTDRRVERTKSFLVEHGVSATAIETRSFGEEDNLTAEQVKAQIAQNPELTPDDRQQMLNNLQRDGPGQQSARGRHLEHHRTTVHSPVPV